MSMPKKRLDKSECSDKTGRVKYNMTLNEVAERLGITRERVLQIEERALRKLKKQFNIDLEDLL